MIDDALFHGLFWGLFVGIMVVRLLSIAQVRKAGERFTPNAQAIKQEGRLAFSVRVIGFFLLIVILPAYAVNPGWMQRLDFRLPVAIHWVGFGLVERPADWYGRWHESCTGREPGGSDHAQ
jgi:hypothetical protein